MTQRINQNLLTISRLANGTLQFLEQRDGFGLGLTAFPLPGTLAILILSIGAMLLGSVVGSVGAESFVGFESFSRDPVQYAWIANLVGYVFTMPVVLWGIAALQPLYRLGIGTTIRGKDVLAAVLCGLLLACVVDGLTAIIEAHYGRHLEDAFGVVRNIHNSGIVVAFIATATIVAPIVEELFFRGLLFNALYVRTRLWIAAALSALLFSAAHMDRIMFLPLLAGGFILGLVYARYRNVTINIGAHMTLNAIGTIGALMLR